MIGRRWLPLVLAAAALAGCTRIAPGHDKAYYLMHDGDRAGEIAACRNDPGRLNATPDCLNANEADGEIVTRRSLSVPPTSSRLAHPGTL